MDYRLKTGLMLSCVAPILWGIYWGIINETVVYQKTLSQALNDSPYNFILMLISACCLGGIILTVKTTPTEKQKKLQHGIQENIRTPNLATSGKQIKIQVKTEDSNEELLDDIFGEEELEQEPEQEKFDEESTVPEESFSRFSGLSPEAEHFLEEREQQVKLEEKRIEEFSTKTKTPKALAKSIIERKAFESLLKSQFDVEFYLLEESESDKKVVTVLGQDFGIRIVSLKGNKKAEPQNKLQQEITLPEIKSEESEVDSDKIPTEEK